MQKETFHVIDACSIALGDTEEFKVNKTRESRKMAKEIKKHQQHTSTDAKPTVVLEQVTTTTVTTVVEEKMTMKEDTNNNNNNTGDIEIKCTKLNLWFIHHHSLARSLS